MKRFGKIATFIFTLLCSQIIFFNISFASEGFEEISEKDSVKVEESMSLKETQEVEETINLSDDIAMYANNHNPNSALLIGAADYNKFLTDTAGSDENWYYVKMAKNKKLSVYMEQPETGDYDIYLYKLNGTTLSLVAGSEFTGSSKEQLSYITTEGSYYIRVVPYTAPTVESTYRFAVVYSEQYDTSEPDDNLWQAKPYTNTVSMSATIDNPLDEDWVQLTIEEGSSYDIGLNFVPDQCQYTAAIYGADLSYIDSVGSTGFATKTLTLNQGIYYIRVLTNGSFSNEKYNLKINPTFGDDLKTVQVAAGCFHSLALKENGELWAWGNNSYGQLADGTTVKSDIPIKVMDNVKFISAGLTQSAIIRENGDLLMVGNNTNSALGTGDQTHRTIPVKILEDVKYVKVTNGGTYAIKENGELWGWGCNVWGDIGDGSTGKRPSPKFIMNNVKKVQTENGFTLALKENGELWGCGHNTAGQLGNGTTKDQYKYIKIMDSVIDIAAGSTCSFAVKESGELWAWGDNNRGQMGDGTTVDRLRPIKIMADVKNVYSSNYHVLALKNDGQLFGWGENTYGQVGNGTVSKTVTTPQKVLDNVVSASCYLHSMAILENDEVWVWGRNKNGELGDGSFVDQSSPVKINIPPTIIFP